MTLEPDPVNPGVGKQALSLYPWALVLDLHEESPDERYTRFLSEQDRQGQPAEYAPEAGALEKSSLRCHTNGSFVE